MAKQLNVDLNLRANTSQAKQSLQQLNTSLNQIVNQRTIIINDAGLQKAQQAAMDLQRHLEAAVNVNTGKLDLAKFSASLTKSGQSLQSLYTNLSAVGPTGQQAFLSLAQSIASANASTITLGSRLGGLLTTLKNTARWQISSAMLHGLISGVRNAFSYAEDLNKSLNNIRIVTGQTTDQMAGFAEQANKAAKALSTSTLKYTDAALIYYQQGIRDQSEIEQRTTTTIKLANVTHQSAEEVSSQLTAIWNNFYDGSKNLEYYADVITKLGANTASSSEEIAGGMQKFAAVADTVGLSYEKSAAALATVVAATRQSEEVVGTAFKTILARVDSLKLGETLDDDVTLGKYAKALETVGVHVLDANNNLKDMDTILDNLGERWSSISEAQKVALAETVAGQRQYAQFMALMNNYDKVLENQGIATDSEGELQKQQDIYAESWEAASKRVKASLEDIYKQLLDDKTFINMLNGISQVVNFIAKLIDNLGGLKGILLIIGTIFMTTYAQKMPDLIQKLTAGFNILTGQAEKNRIAMLAQVRDITSSMSNIGNTSALQGQIAGVQKLTEAYYDYNTIKSKLSSLQVTEYENYLKELEIRSTNLQKLGEEKDAIDKTVDSLTKKIELQTRNTVVPKETLSNDLENLKSRDTSNLMQNMSQMRGLDKNSADYKKLYQEMQRYSQQIKGIQTIQDKIAKGPFTRGDVIKGFKQAATQVGNMKNALDAANQKTSIWSSNLKNIINNSKGFDNLKKDMTSTVEALEQAGFKTGDLQQQIQKLGANSTVDDIENVISSIRQLSELDDTVNTLANAEGQLDAFTTALHSMGAEEADINAIIDALQQAGLITQQYGNQLKELNGQNFNPKPAHDFAGALSNVASFGMRAAMAINAMKSIGNIWSDDDASVGEKIVQTMMSLGMIIPTVVAGYHALAGSKLLAAIASKKSKQADTEETVEKGVNTTATWANTTAEIANQSAKAGIGAPAVAALIIGTIVAITAAMVVATTATNKNTEALKKNREAQEEKAKSAAENLQTVNDEVNSLNELIKKYEELEKAEEDVVDIQSEIQDQTKTTMESFEKLADSLKLSGSELETYIKLMTQLKAAMYANDEESVKKLTNEINQLLIAQTVEEAKKGLTAATDAYFDKDMEKAGKHASNTTKEIHFEDWSFKYGDSQQVAGEAFRKYLSDFITFQLEDQSAGPGKFSSVSFAYDTTNPSNFIDFYEGMEAAYDYWTENVASGNRQYDDMMSHEAKDYLNNLQEEYNNIKTAMTAVDTAIISDLLVNSQDERENISSVAEYESYVADLKEKVEKDAKEGGRSVKNALETLDNALEDDSLTKNFYKRAQEFDNLSNSLGETESNKIKEWYEKLSDEQKETFSHMETTRIVSLESAKALFKFQEALDMQDQASAAALGLKKLKDELKGVDTDWDKVQKNLTELNIDLDIEQLKHLSETEAKNVIDTYIRDNISTAVKTAYSGLSSAQDDLKAWENAQGKRQERQNYYQTIVQRIKNAPFSKDDSFDNIQAQLIAEGTFNQFAKLFNFAKNSDNIITSDRSYSSGTSTGGSFSGGGKNFGLNEDTFLDLENELYHNVGIFDWEKEGKNKRNAIETMQAKVKEQIDSFNINIVQNSSSLQELNDNIEFGNSLFKEGWLGATDYQAALQSLANQYENTTEELLKYQQALASENSQLIAETENTLKLSIRSGELAAQFNLTAEQIEQQAKLFKQDAKYADLTGTELANLAAKNQRVNRGVKTLNENFTDWSKILKSGNTLTTDYAETALAAAEAVADLTGALDAAHVPVAFLQSAENLALLEKAAQGDIDAIQALGFALAESQLQELTDQGFNVDKVLEGIQNLQTALKDGLTTQSLGEALSEDWIESLNQMAQNTKMTVDEMNSFLSEIGVSIPVETEYHPVERKMPKIRTHHEITRSGLFSESYDEVISSETVPGEEVTITENIPIAKIGKNAKVTYTGATGGGGISASSTSGGNKSSSSSSKSKATPKTMKDESERYHVIKEQIDDLSNAYSRLNKEKDKAFGANRLKVMDQELANLKAQEKAQQKYLNEIRNYRQSDYTALINGQEQGFNYNGDWYKTQGAAAYGVNVQLDENGVITNIDELKQAALNKYNEVVAYHNALDNDSASKDKSIELAEKQYSSFMELIKQYEESNNLLEDETEKLNEIRDSIQEGNAKKLEYKYEIKFEISANEKKRLEYEIKKLGDDVFKSVEVFSKMFSQNSSSNLTNATQELSDYRKEFDELTTSYQNGEISEAVYIDGLKRVRDGTYENLEALLDLKDSAKEYYSETLSKLNEKFKETTDLMSHQASVLEHLKDILSLDQSLVDYTTLGKVLEAQEKVNRQNYEAAIAENQFMQDQLALRTQEYEKALKSGGETEKEIAETNLKAAQEAANEAEEGMYAAAKTLGESIKISIQNAIEATYDSLAKDYTNGLGFDYLNQTMELYEKTSERFLTKTNQVYEINKLSRQLQQNIDKTTNIAAKQRLANLDKEIEALGQKEQLSKNELELAQKRMEVTLAEIALEEAQNAKTTVRLQRDAEGNYGYVYTADQDKIDDAEQKVADARNDLYNTAREQENSLAKDLISINQERFEALKAIDENETLSWEEKFKRKQEINDLYTAEINALTDDRELARQVVIETSAENINDTWTNHFEDMIVEQETFKQDSEAKQDELNKYTKAKTEELDQLVTDIINPDLESVTEKTDEIVASNQALLKTLTGEDGLIQKSKETADAIANETLKFGAFYDELNKKVIPEAEKLISDIDDLIKKSAQDITYTIKYNPIGTRPADIHDQNATYTVHYVSDYSGSEGNSKGGLGEELVSNSRYTYVFTLTDSQIKTFYSGAAAFDYYDKNNKKVKKLMITNNDTNNTFEPTDDYWTYLHYMRQIGYDTGGYTGNWFSSSLNPEESGKLAFLHQKELVLNQEDTKNMLAAVNIVRSLQEALDLRTAAYNFDSQLTSGVLTGANGELEQNITIHADFPNVQDHNEIKEALENLALRAAQYATRNK